MASIDSCQYYGDNPSVTVRLPLISEGVFLATGTIATMSINRKYISMNFYHPMGGGVGELSEKACEWGK